MLKTTQSFDGSLGIDSFLSPIRNNKSSKFYQTAASLQYSEFSNNQTFLKLNSGRSSGQEYQYPKMIKQQSAINVQTTPREVSESRLRQLQQFQKWVAQSFAIYNEGKHLLRDNEQRIRILQHKNRLKKDEIVHMKNMSEYFKQKYTRSKKQLKKKNILQESKIKLKIKQSKERTEQLYEQIQQLRSEINQQKRLSVQLKLKSRTKTQQSAHHRPFFNPYYGNMYMNPNMPNHYPNPNLHSFHPNFIQRSGEEQNTQSRTQSIIQLKRSPSFDNQTARFLSKKVSQNSQPNSLTEPNTNNFIISALAAQIGRVTNPNSNSGHLKKSSGQMSGKWQNSEQQKDVLNILEGKQKSKQPAYKKILNKKNLSISQDYEQSYDNLYSPTNVVQTPGFDLLLNQNLNNKGGSFSSIHQLQQQKSNPYSSSTSTPHKRQSNKRVPNVQQSKIRISVDQSLSQFSKYSLDKRKKPQGLKQSSIKIDILEDDSRSGENSMQKDGHQNSARTRNKSPTIQSRKASQSLQVQERSSSQIVLKKNTNIISPPPKLPVQKRLRKVTEQQSDLFDSYGQPRMAAKNQADKVDANNYNSVNSNKQKSDVVSVKDVVLDNSNIKQSVAVPFNWDAIPTSRTTKQQKMEKEMQQAALKKKTDEQDDDDDFMNVNLLAVSKISKQKQLSEKAFNTLSDDGNQGVSKKNLIRHSYTPLEVPFNKSQIPFEDIIEEQNDFYDDEKEKREQNIKRARKNSGSRFSTLFQPNAQSMELRIEENKFN